MVQLALRGGGGGGKEKKIVVGENLGEREKKTSTKRVVLS